MWRRASAGGVVAILIAAALVSCSDSATPWALPDRADPAVQAAEAQLAEKIAARDASGETTCRVRLLGTEAPSTSYAWAFCEGDSGWAWSAPVRVDGDEVKMPQDGSPYADDVRDLFPDGLEGRILAADEELQP